MRSIAVLEHAISAVTSSSDVRSGAREFLQIGEEILEHWIVAHDDTPTSDTREGFRLLALHRQAAKGDPSFNACRETCRELAYHFNLLEADREHAKAIYRLEMMRMVCNHLFLFVSGKLQVAGLGDFCCSSRPLRQAADIDLKTAKGA